VAAIAEEARVALKTVYTVFGTKAEVLRVLLNLRMRGDDEPLPLYERPWYREIVAQPDPEKKLELLARASRLVKERTSDTLETSASGVDGSGHRGGLRAPGELALEPVAAADMLWTLNHPTSTSSSSGWARARPVLVGLVASQSALTAPAPGRENPVRLENLTCGSRAWKARRLPRHVLEGYPSEVSSSSSPPVRWSGEERRSRSSSAPRLGRVLRYSCTRP
jgi:hypothetical protein